MAETISDDVFDAGSDENHLHSLSNSTNAPIVNENIYKILTPTDLGDVGVEFNEDIGDNDAEKLISGPEMHSNSSENTIYSQ